MTADREDRWGTILFLIVSAYELHSGLDPGGVEKAFGSAFVWSVEREALGGYS